MCVYGIYICISQLIHTSTAECLWKYTNLVTTKLSHSLHKNIQRLLGTEPDQYAEVCERKTCLQTVMKYGMTLSLMKEMIYFFDMYTLCPLIELEPTVDQGGHRSTRGYNGNVPCQPSDEELYNAIKERMEISGGNNQLRRVLLAANNLKPSLGQSKLSPISADKDLVIKYLLKVYQTIAEQKDGSKTPKNPFQPGGRMARLSYKMVRDHVNNMLEKEYPIGLCIFVQVHQIHIWNSTNVMHVHKDMVIERNSNSRGTKRDRFLFLKIAEGHMMGEELTHLSDLGIEYDTSRRLTLTELGAIVFEPTTALVNITDVGRIVLAEQASNFYLEGTGDDEGLSQSKDGKEQSEDKTSIASEEASSLNRNDDDESSSWQESISPEGMSITGRASPDGMSSTGRNDDDESALWQAGDSDMSIAGRNDDDESAPFQVSDMSVAGCSTAFAEQFLDDDGASRQESISPEGMSITGRASPDDMSSTGWSIAVADADQLREMYGTLPSWDIDSLSLPEGERLFFKTYDREPSDNPLIFDQSPLPPPLPLLAEQLLDDDGASRQESISPEGMSITGRASPDGMSSTGWMSEMILRMAELERHAIANNAEHELLQSEFGTLLYQDFFKLERWYYSRFNQPRESSVDGHVEV